MPCPDKITVKAYLIPMYSWTVMVVSSIFRTFENSLRLG